MSATAVTRLVFVAHALVLTQCLRLHNSSSSAVNHTSLQLVDDDVVVEYPRDSTFEFEQDVSQQSCQRIDDEVCGYSFKLQKSEIHIFDWLGRLGNNVQQIGNALLVAEGLGKRYLTWSPPYADDVFNMKGRIFVRTNREFQRQAKCVHHSGVSDQAWLDSGKGKYFCKKPTPQSACIGEPNMFCKGSSDHDLRRVLLQYLMPRLNVKAKVACISEKIHPFDGLTIHLRSGDLLDSDHFQSKFAPCAFFDAVIKEHGFRKVRIVTEPDRKHPCLAAIQQRHKDLDIRIQSKSIEEDACALMHAKHLAVGSQSTFSIAFGKLLNTGITSYFTPFGSAGHCSAVAPALHQNVAHANMSSGCRQASTFVYCVPGIDEVKRGAAKQKFMLDTPLSSIHALRKMTQCDLPPGGLWPAEGR